MDRQVSKVVKKKDRGIRVVLRRESQSQITAWSKLMGDIHVQQAKGQIKSVYLLVSVLSGRALKRRLSCKNVCLEKKPQNRKSQNGGKLSKPRKRQVFSNDLSPQSENIKNVRYFLMFLLVVKIKMLDFSRFHSILPFQ